MESVTWECEPDEAFPSRIALFREFPHIIFFFFFYPSAASSEDSVSTSVFQQSLYYPFISQFPSLSDTRGERTLLLWEANCVEFALENATRDQFQGTECVTQKCSLAST